MKNRGYKRHLGNYAVALEKMKAKGQKFATPKEGMINRMVKGVNSDPCNRWAWFNACFLEIGGNLFALGRFYQFIKKIQKNKKFQLKANNKIEGFCLKADIKHYFQEVNQQVLLDILKRKMKNEKTINLINKILKNYPNKEKGMPLGNLTSQFFANVYLNELDRFVKHNLKIKYYIRYVDDFVILHNSEDQLKKWKLEINKFLQENLKIELHPEKSRIISLSRGVDFVGFRNFYYHRLLRKRNVKKMIIKMKLFKENLMPYEKLLESFQGWNAYAKWSNRYKLREKVLSEINYN